MSTAAAARPPRLLARLVWPVVIVAVLVAMAMDTRFLSGKEVTALNPAEFNAKDFAAAQYPKIVSAVEAKAVDLKEVATAVADDPEAAGKKYGNIAGTDKYAIPVRFTGKISEAEAGLLTVDVAGLPKGSVVRVAVGQAANGTALRDVPGTLKFKDFQNQTDYQQVANELKTRMLADVAGKVDVAAARGAKASVVAVYVTNTGPEGSYLVTPVKIEVAG
jgi:predicted lipoprotein